MVNITIFNIYIVACFAVAYKMDTFHWGLGCSKATELVCVCVDWNKSISCRLVCSIQPFPSFFVQQKCETENCWAVPFYYFGKNVVPGYRPDVKPYLIEPIKCQIPDLICTWHRTSHTQQFTHPTIPFFRFKWLPFDHIAHHYYSVVIFRTF